MKDYGPDLLLGIIIAKQSMLYGSVGLDLKASLYETALNG